MFKKRERPKALLPLGFWFQREGQFFGALFFWRPFFFGALLCCFSAGKTERSDAYVKRAGPQGVLGCNTLSPKRSVGLQKPKPKKECWVATP